MINTNYSHPVSFNPGPLPIKDLGLSKEALMALAPTLEYVDCRGLELDEIENFIHLCTKARQIFIKSDKVKSLNFMHAKYSFLQVLECDTPNLTELRCPNVNSLTTLTLKCADELEFIECYECTSLTTLSLPPAIPKMEWINCAGCPALTALSIPYAPQLNSFTCRNCTALTTLSLPSAPQLVRLYCYSCPALTAIALPNSPGLGALECFGNKALRTIELCNTPDLLEICCDGCTVLTTLSIPYAPRLFKLHCRNCTHLSRIDADALPGCINLVCSDCPLLRGFPQLPPTATVYSGGSNQLVSFTVHPEELDQNPREVLLALGRHLLANQPMPNIVWWDPLTNAPAKGIDAGGLRRQLITTLCDNLFKEGSKFPFTDKFGGKLPILSDQEDQAAVLALRTFARLIALCSTSTLLLGEHLPHSFFYALRSIIDDQKVEEKKIYLNLLGLWDPEISPQANYANNQGELDNMLPVTLPIELAAQELKALPGFSLDSLRQDPVRFIESVKGKSITKEGLLVNLQTEGMREYFVQFMEENPHQLVKLAELFTSCRTLGDRPIMIHVFPDRDPGQLPLIHTCSQEVEMPLYPTYERFKEKLNLAFSTLKTFENA